MKTIAITKRSKLDDKDTLRAVVSNHADKGLTVGQMRVFLKILDKIEAASDSLALEDAEYAALVRQFDATPFRIIHPDIVALRDAIGAATDATASQEA